MNDFSGSESTASLDSRSSGKKRRTEISKDAHGNEISVKIQVCDIGRPEEPLEIEMQIGPTTTWHSLMSKIEAGMRVPITCQRLVLGNTIVQPTANMLEAVKDLPAVHIDVIVSLDCLEKELIVIVTMSSLLVDCNLHIDGRLADWFKSLALLGPRAGDRGIAMCVTCISTRFIGIVYQRYHAMLQDTLLAALHCLKSVVRARNTTAIGIASTFLDESYPADVRREALLFLLERVPAFRCFCEKDDQRACLIDILCSDGRDNPPACLTPGGLQEGVRAASQNCRLESLAEQGDSSAIATIAELFFLEDDLARSVATQALNSVYKGISAMDAAALAGVIERLPEGEWCIRCAIEQALLSIAAESKATTTTESTVAALLCTGDSEMQGKKARSLACVMEKTCDAVSGPHREIAVDVEDRELLDQDAPEEEPRTAVCHFTHLQSFSFGDIYDLEDQEGADEEEEEDEEDEEMDEDAEEAEGISSIELSPSSSLSEYPL